MNETTSARKMAKKARQIYRKDVQNEAREMGRMLGNHLKPKPRWVPWFLWLAGIRIFMRVK